MAWPTSTHYGSGRDAVASGRKGGRSPRRNPHRRTLEYTKGYAAGWIACKRLAARAEQTRGRTKVEETERNFR